MANPELLWDDGGESQLKIVLLGGRNSAKSSVGNALLGREEFVTRERTTCSRRRGVLAGRWVSVVDTPGWWCDFGARDSAALVRRGIAGSVLLCYPGPHVFLLVVKARSPFSERRRAALEQHVALLGEAAWRHCVLVLTCVDGRAHGPPGEGPPRDGALAWLVEKCGRRWHRLALAGDTLGGDTLGGDTLGGDTLGGDTLGGDTLAGQVVQLLVKMQTLAAENADRPFELEPSRLRRLNRNMKTVEERALQRFLRTKERRTRMQGDSRHLSDLRVVLIGATGSGKTSVAGAMVGGGGGGGEARREGAAGRTARCQVHRGAAAGRHVMAVDTPGWWSNFFAAESSAFDRREIARGARLCPPAPHALLLVVRADRAFTDTHRRAAQEHVELLLGPEAWGHTLLVFSFGDWLGDTSIERHVESEGEPLRWLVDRCGDRYHVMCGQRAADGAGFQVAELAGKVEEMVAANEGRVYHRAGGAAAAGDRLEEQRRRTEEERAARRLLAKTKQRRASRSPPGELRRLPELRLVLLGGGNAGKTSCGDTILGRVDADDPAAAGAAAACVERRARVGDVAVTLLDTSQRPPPPPPPPPSSRDHDRRRMTRRDVASDPSALLLVVNVSAAFTSSLLEALEEQMSGGAEEEEEERWSRAMVLFSHGDWLGNTSVEERIESEGEALRTLVDRCGNRYHVLDNRRRGDHSQVHQLLEQIEEMLVGAGLASIRRGDPIGRSVTPAARRGGEGSAVCRLNGKTPDVRLSCTGNPGPLDGPGDTSLSCQVVARLEKPESALSACRDVSSMAAWSGLRGNKVLRWTLSDIKTVMGILSNWSWAASPHGRAEVPSEGRVGVISPRHRGSALAWPPPRRSPLAGATEDDIVAAPSLRPPRDAALKKLFEAGDLQALIDQWGSSSLEELEAFVDAHFEMVWERAMSSASADDVTEPGGAAAGAEQSVISSIMEKLSKLHLLEDIQRDLTEVKQGLDRCWKIMQELMEAHGGNQHRAEEGS